MPKRERRRSLTFEDQVKELIRRTRLTSGVPEFVEDETILRRIAEIIAQPREA